MVYLSMNPSVALCACLLILSAGLAGASARKVAGAAVQCGVVGEAEFCERTSCYIVQVNDTCGDGLLVEAPAPACDQAYYASFVASFGDALFVLYESPEREANGYESMRDALEWFGSVKSLTDCVVQNSTAYTEVGKADKSGGSGGDDDTYLKVILIIIVIAVGLALVVAIGLIVAIAAALAVRKWRKATSVTI